MKPEVEHDPTVKTFTNWLAEMKVQNNRTVQEILSETSIIRDSITTNNMELTDFKRHSSGISQQMQSQLTDLREKLTSAFGEITALVKQKTQSDTEMMQDVNTLQQNLSQKTYELEALKKSYSQAHQHLQSSLIQMQNHLQVTKNEVGSAKAACDRERYRNRSPCAMGKKLKRKTAAAAVAEVAALDAPKLKQKVKRRKRKAKEPGPMGPSAPANLESPQSWLARANADRVELRQEGVDWGLFATSQLPPNEVLLQIPEKKGAVEGTFGVAQWPEVFQPLVKRLGLTASAHPSSECGAEESLLVRPKKANVRLDGPTLHTSRDLKAGEQLSLGPTRENALLLLQHGFATSDNPHDLVRLALAESRQVTLSRRGIPQDVADAIEQEQDTQQFVSLLKGILEKRRALTDCQKQLPKAPRGDGSSSWKISWSRSSPFWRPAWNRCGWQRRRRQRKMLRERRCRKKRKRKKSRCSDLGSVASAGE
ncbi:unnamed protein product [Effrenium voratum]|uniref:Uncharacterized protein n=1 Tax=Effrenium voratum TaxID=2562239 RepID=A0AA36HJ31_9DINO|nr:unnamed protein product [Effrenium voratum]